MTIDSSAQPENKENLDLNDDQDSYQMFTMGIRFSSRRDRDLTVLAMKYFSSKNYINKVSAY